MRNRNYRFRVTVQSKAPSQVRIKSLWLSGMVLCITAWLLTAAPAYAKDPSGEDLLYATQFSVEVQSNGTSLITIGNQDRYLLVPENVPVPADVPEDVTVLCQPLDCIYLAASSAMDFYRELGILDQVRLTSTKVADWSLSQVKDALENGTMLYAGRYSTPDYELILGEGTKLAIESTMIYHSPETKETLESLGIPVLVERSSYEPDPLGRMEWIRLYGLLAGCKDQADSFFEKQISRLKHIQQTQTGKRVVFFHISGSGYAVVRKPGDYVSRMIAMAGGEYFLGTDKDPQDNALSTMNMEMESFYEAARDADILIYNSTIDGDIRTIDELLGKSPLLADFRAVKEGNVWCTGRNMFQQATGIGEMILDLSRIIQGSTDNGEELTYLHPVI